MGQYDDSRFKNSEFEVDMTAWLITRISNYQGKRYRVKNV